MFNSSVSDSDHHQPSNADVPARSPDSKPLEHPPTYETLSTDPDRTPIIPVLSPTHLEKGQTKSSAYRTRTQPPTFAPYPPPLPPWEKSASTEELLSSLPAQLRLHVNRRVERSNTTPPREDDSVDVLPSTLRERRYKSYYRTPVENTEIYSGTSIPPPPWQESAPSEELLSSLARPAQSLLHVNQRVQSNDASPPREDDSVKDDDLDDDDQSSSSQNEVLSSLKFLNRLEPVRLREVTAETPTFHNAQRVQHPDTGLPTRSLRFSHSPNELDMLSYTVDGEPNPNKLRIKFRRALAAVAATVTSLACTAYHTSHFMLPSIYRSRINQLLNESNLTTQEIAYLSFRLAPIVSQAQKLGLQGAGRKINPLIPELPESYKRLKEEWNNMIDDFVEEWRTMNIVSAMLVPGILTLFQMNDAANDPVTRGLAFWSLILALWSLIYGCMYIIQFRRMRSKYTVIAWALEAQNNRLMFWNVWVMLSLPAVSLAWSVLVFMTAIIWFMWRSRANPPTDFVFSAPPMTEFSFRMITSAFLVIALFYFILATTTSFQYGSPTMGQWEGQINSMVLSMHAMLTQAQKPPSQTYFKEYPPAVATD